MSLKAKEVLTVLDEYIDPDPISGLAPLIYQLWTHYFPADTRLSVFRSQEHWAVFIEIVCFRPGQNDSALEIWGYGNCLSDPALLWYDMPYTFCPAASADGEDGYPDTPFDFCIVWNGEPRTFTPSPEEYAALGIVVDTSSETNGNHIGGYILRFLCERLNHPFFTSEPDLRKMMADAWRGGEPCNNDMVLFWQTQRWRHPTLAGDDSDKERPRHLPYFQSLARAIETGNVTELECQDPATFNTDWRIWDEQERAIQAELDFFQAQTSKELTPEMWLQLTPEMQEQVRAMFEDGLSFSEWMSGTT